VIARAGDRAAWRSVEFFTVNIRNRNTRVAYSRAAAMATTMASLVDDRRDTFTVGNLSHTIAG
jgi:hypothetical protein